MWDVYTDEQGRSNETGGPPKHLSESPSHHHVPTKMLYLLCTQRQISYYVPACSSSLQCYYVKRKALLSSLVLRKLLNCVVVKRSGNLVFDLDHCKRRKSVVCWAKDILEFQSAEGPFCTGDSNWCGQKNSWGSLACGAPSNWRAWRAVATPLLTRYFTVKL